MEHKGFAALTVLFLVLAWNSWKNEKLQNEQIATYVANAPSTIAVNATSTRSNTNDSQHANIEATLRLVAQKYKTTDVNGDGLFNCIDAAVLFYKLYPVRDRVAIIVNVNPITDMNHLFNAVLINGVWRAVEPQAYTCPNWERLQTYFMHDIWGNQYDKNYNHDETEKWKVYAR